MWLHLAISLSQWCYFMWSWSPMDSNQWWRYFISLTCYAASFTINSPMTSSSHCWTPLLTDNVMTHQVSATESSSRVAWPSLRLHGILVFHQRLPLLWNPATVWLLVPHRRGLLCYLGLTILRAENWGSIWHKPLYRWYANPSWLECSTPFFFFFATRFSLSKITPFYH